MKRINGFTMHGVTITVQHFPDRKKPMLCLSRKGKNSCVAVASFSSEENAECFIGVMYEFLNGVKKIRRWVTLMP